MVNERNLNENRMRLDSLPDYIGQCDKPAVEPESVLTEIYDPRYAYNRCIDGDLLLEHFTANLDFDPVVFEEGDLDKLERRFRLCRVVKSDRGFLEMVNLYRRLYDGIEKAENPNSKSFVNGLEEAERHLLFLEMLAKNSTIPRVDVISFFGIIDDDVSLEWFGRYDIERGDLIRYLYAKKVNRWYFASRERQWKSGAIPKAWKPSVLPYEYANHKIYRMLDCDDELFLWHINADFMKRLMALHKAGLPPADIYG